MEQQTSISNPSVSVVLITWAPTKYRIKLLKNTLTTLRNSTEVPFKLIVVDNGPKEQTDFLKTQEINKHIINKVNMGIGYARNQGIEAASGKYICLLDNDVELKKDWIKESIEALETYPLEKLIVSPFFNAASRKGKRRRYLGRIGKYNLWQRAGPACWVLRKSVFDEFGKWSTGNTPGRIYCRNLTRAGYKFIGFDEEKAIHKGKRKSYNFKRRFVDGKWIKNGK